MSKVIDFRKSAGLLSRVPPILPRRNACGVVAAATATPCGACIASAASQ